jgi:hypothetical protein
MKMDNLCGKVKVMNMHGKPTMSFENHSSSRTDFRNPVGCLWLVVVYYVMLQVVLL